MDTAKTQLEKLHQQGCMATIARKIKIEDPVPVVTAIAEGMILKHRADAAVKKHRASRHALVTLYSKAMLALDKTSLKKLFRAVGKPLPKWAQDKVLRASERKDSERADISKLTLGDIKKLADKYAFHDDSKLFSEVLISEGHKSVTRGTVQISLTRTK